MRRHLRISRDHSAKGLASESNIGVTGGDERRPEGAVRLRSNLSLLQPNRISNPPPEMWALDPEGRPALLGEEG
jgi:hypothetical protein